MEDLVPLRYARMSVSPFTFLRGSAQVMAYDLASGPSTDLEVRLCGDAHLSNFGAFASPERRLMFDLNDFDEASPGPVRVGCEATRREHRRRRSRQRLRRRRTRRARSMR